MIKLLPTTITSCSECPFCSIDYSPYVGETFIYYCAHPFIVSDNNSFKFISETYPGDIPEWCILDTKDEVVG